RWAASWPRSCCATPIRCRPAAATAGNSKRKRPSVSPASSATPTNRTPRATSRCCGVASRTRTNAAWSCRSSATPTTEHGARPPPGYNRPMRIAATLLSCRLAACASGGDAMQPGTETVDAMMATYAGDQPGAALLVVRDGVPVVRKGYGLADLERGIAVGPDTNFRLASVSKQFTATAILLLAQDGALTLDDPVRRWLPSLPAAADGITLHHLLSHTSGLVDYE